MSKNQIIDAIRTVNQSAVESFLVRFDEQALSNYLKRLSLTQSGRGRQTIWVREGHSPAIITRQA